MQHKIKTVLAVMWAMAYLPFASAATAGQPVIRSVAAPLVQSEEIGAAFEFYPQLQPNTREELRRWLLEQEDVDRQTFTNLQPSDPLSGNQDQSSRIVHGRRPPALDATPITGSSGPRLPVIRAVLATPKPEIRSASFAMSQKVCAWPTMCRPLARARSSHHARRSLSPSQHSQAYASRSKLNVSSFSTEIVAASRAFGIDANLVRAVIHAESSFNPSARSHVGAQGLMQLMPATAARFGVSDPLEASQNIRGGVRYLAWLLKRFNGDSRLATAAYNAGEGAVDRYRGIPPYRETVDYVDKVATLFQRYQEVAPR